MARYPEIGSMALCAALVACGPLPVSLSDASQSFGSRDYERIFERWTRETQAYNLDTLENALTVSATYRSWELRQAWVQRYADDYRLSEQQVEAMLAEQRSAYEASHEFVVASTATKPKWADFLRDDSPWVVALVNDRGAEVAPASIEGLEHTPELLTYYPFINVYRKTFLMRFDRTTPDGDAILDPGIGSFTLLFSGALGRAQLTWKVKK